MKGDSSVEVIKNYLAQQFPATKKVSADDPLLGGGLIDSLGILEVVTFLEKEFDLIIVDDDLSPENFGSVRSIARLVEQKKSN